MRLLVAKIAMIGAFLLGACAPRAVDSPAVPGRWYTVAQLESGRALYAVHCAQCHGADAGATPHWRKPGPDGHYPPPPLNGTAHAWHHPLAQLDRTIARGGADYGGVMPGFGETLDEAERLAIVAYLQSLWPEAIYANWRAIDERSR